MTSEQLDQLSINTIRTLSIDAVQQAKSGHPGTPMALAPLVYTLWNRVMRFDPVDPIWPNRDRFVLSNGHASMLLWSVLHLTGTRAVNADYERLGLPSVSLDDIRRFRQLDSKAPGHPEYHWVSGVETTTGPLGQGVHAGGVADQAIHEVAVAGGEDDDVGGVVAEPVGRQLRHARQPGGVGPVAHVGVVGRGAVVGLAGQAQAGQV